MQNLRVLRGIERLLMLSSRYLSGEKERERERKTYLFDFIFFFSFLFFFVGSGAYPPHPARDRGRVVEESLVLPQLGPSFQGWDPSTGGFLVLGPHS
jgi:hypothetical protein